MSTLRQRLGIMEVAERAEESKHHNRQALQTAQKYDVKAFTALQAMWNEVFWA